MLEGFAGLGYGPQPLPGRKLFSEASSIRLSNLLNRSLGALELGRLGRWVADVS